MFDKHCPCMSKDINMYIDMQLHLLIECHYSNNLWRNTCQMEFHNEILYNHTDIGNVMYCFGSNKCHHWNKYPLHKVECYNWYLCMTQDIYKCIIHCQDFDKYHCLDLKKREILSLKMVISYIYMDLKNTHRKASHN